MLTFHLDISGVYDTRITISIILYRVSKADINFALCSKLNESNHKLELQLKETSENEKVLTQLLKEFEELSKELG